MRIVDAPWPQPTSATVAPAVSFAVTPSRQPFGHQVGAVAGSEEPLAAQVHVGVVLVPAPAAAGAGGFDDGGGVVGGAVGELEEPRQERRAGFVGQRDGVLGGQRVATGGRVVVDEPTGGLGVEPLPRVVHVGGGAFGQLGRRRRPGAGQGAVVPQPVAHHDERGVQRCADLADGAEDEGHQPIAVDGRFAGGGGRGHGGVLRVGFTGRADCGRPGGSGR
jgi:hypothetical protein